MRGVLKRYSHILLEAEEQRKKDEGEMYVQKHVSERAAPKSDQLKENPVEKPKGVESC